MRAGILLKDGTQLEGKSFGFSGVSGGELVFNTSMMGYQEMLTDPSYAGQLLMLTYPMIGNYGINEEDIESKKIQAAGLIVGHYVNRYSNFRAKYSLQDYLVRNRIVGLSHVDTRALTRRIRDQGSQNAVIFAEGKFEEAQHVLKNLPSMEGLDLASAACAEPNNWNWSSQGRQRIVLIDLGLKWNIAREVEQLGAQVVVVPPSITESELLKLKPHGLLISNGPGDPAVIPGIQKTLQACIGKFPILGICLGHQLLGLAVGGKTYKLKFGHRGANHPVKNIQTGRIEITSQNHGFAVDANSLEKVSGNSFGKINLTHMHLTDDTVEGFELPEVKVRAIQFHPESCPGPHDSKSIFKEFLCTIEKFSTV